MRTQVAIIGAGPAGLMLGHLLQRAGIDSVVLEARSREYVEHRVRAGVLEHGSVELLAASGVGDRLAREGLVHRGIELRFEGRGHRIDFPSLAGGRTISVYGQQEVVKDLVAARVASGAPLLFDASHVEIGGFDGDHPTVRFEHAGKAHVLACDFIAGCDGFHGVCRGAIPADAITVHERAYPFAWLGILAQAPPAHDELVYAHHERGFALFSMRSQAVTRLYLQVAPDERAEAWTDEAIWAELERRFEGEDGWRPHRGPVLEKGVTGMRSFVAEPMRFGRLFLAGDAAHIVPPTGAKGMNLALGDARVLAAAFAAHYRDHDDEALDGYSATCLARVWRAEHFSWWMTSMLHRFPESDSFQRRLQLSQLRYVVASRAAAASLAENYVGFLAPGTGP
jgi:p-hydroxybenzoate 3-monooxygenase